MNVLPISSPSAILSIGNYLAHSPYDLCLFTLGIHTGLSAEEMVSLTGGQVDCLVVGDHLKVGHTETSKGRSVQINSSVSTALNNWLSVHPDLRNNGSLFISPDRRRALTVSIMDKKVEKWCQAIELDGCFGADTLRKTWGYHQLLQDKNILPSLMQVFGHTTQSQTLEYLCTQEGGHR